MIRVLAHYDEKTGSHYHRIHLPCENLKKISNDFEIIAKKNLVEQDFANCDILYYNRFIKIAPIALNKLRKRYGFKIVVDMDDKVYIPKDHYMYNFYEKDKIPEKIIGNLISADYLICSTDYLAEDLKQYNENIVVIPNSIDFSVEQYQFKERIESDKLRVIYPCSISHMHDVKLLEQSFKRIKSDSYTNLRTSFTLAGYNTTNEQTKKLWTSMTDIYKYLGKYNTAGSLETNQYMKHYDNQDVCIIPLRTTEFEKSKSNLKLLEAGAKKCAVIASNVIPYIYDTGNYLPVENKIDWYLQVKELVKNKELLKEYQDKLHNYVKTNFDMDNINIKRVELFNDLYKNYTYNNKDTKIISIAYKPEQYTEYTTYLNPVNTIEDKSYLFEYNPIVKIFNENLFDINNYKYVGVFSWKFAAKTGLTEREIYKHIDNEHDIYILIRPFFKNGNEYFTFSEKVHPGITEIIKLLCKDLNLEFTNNPEHIVYSNFVIVDRELYRKYINDIIIPAIALLEDKYKDLAWRNSRYPGLSKEELNKHTGLDYYPMHTFLLERLMSIYLHNNKNIRVKNCIGKN